MAEKSADPLAKFHIFRYMSDCIIETIGPDLFLSLLENIRSLFGKHKKACSQSLLMRRTAADRERIITEKVAIVLMNTNKISSPVVEPSEPRLLFSAFLNERFNTLRKLWNLSQADLGKVKPDRFYTDILLAYMSSPLDHHLSYTEGSDSEAAKEAGDGKELEVSDEDMFGSGDESSKGPSPKRPRSDDQGSSTEINASPSPSPCRVTPRSDPNESISAANISGGTTSASCHSGEEALSLRVSTSDLVAEVKAAGSLDVDCEAPTPLKPPSRTSMENNSVNASSVDQPSNKHLVKLSSDLLSLYNSSASNVIVIHKGPRKLYAHECVFRVRCHALYNELVKNPKCLDGFSVDVCEAVFRYIYAGDVVKAASLNFEEKNQLTDLCLRFGMEVLAEEVFPKNENTAEELSVTKSVCASEIARPEVEAEHEDDVIVLDSDSCSAEEKTATVATAVNPSDDELDRCLKDGVRFLEKNSATDGNTEEHPVDSSSLAGTKQPKRSIEKYFRDSFPSLDGICVTPVPDQNRRRSEPTPCSSRDGIKDCVTPGGQLVVSELATPIPDYESMVTPDLKDALQKYGIKKGIGRKKAVTLLRYIYDQIHPPSDHPAVAKAIDDVKSKPNPSTLESDSDVYSLSSDSSGDEIFEDLGDVFHEDVSDTQSLLAEPGLLQKVGKYIKSNTLLYAAILKYEPIWLNKFHQTLKENNIKCNKAELMDVLDELGVTFRTEQTEKQLQRRNRKPARRKKQTQSQLWL